MFAKFESEEQTAIATVLKGLSTPMMPLDTKATTVMDRLKNASGNAFDRAYMQSQVHTHQELRSLTENFLKLHKGTLT